MVLQSVSPALTDTISWHSQRSSILGPLPLTAYIYRAVPFGLFLIYILSLDRNYSIEVYSSLCWVSAEVFPFHQASSRGCATRHYGKVELVRRGHLSGSSLPPGSFANRDGISVCSISDCVRHQYFSNFEIGYTCTLPVVSDSNYWTLVKAKLRISISES